LVSGIDANGWEPVDTTTISPPPDFVQNLQNTGFSSGPRRQNIENKGFKIQNLDNARLRSAMTLPGSFLS
jgi:hypothetical protein